MHPSRARRAVRLAALLTALGGVVVATLGVGPAGAAQPLQRSMNGDPTGTPHVVVLGVSGLTWDDVTPGQTPALWSLAGDSAIGSLVVRGVFQRTCAADGWLTLGAGGRAVAPRGRLTDGDLVCRPVPSPGWQAVVDENTGRYDPPFGVVADSVSEVGGCSTAAGPGAALMLADSDGVVSSYRANPATVGARLLARCPVTAVDLGEVAPAPGSLDRPEEGSGGTALAPTRTRSLQRLDAEVARLRGLLPDQATLLLVSTGDETARARLRVLTAVGPGGGDLVYGPGLLTTTSTRRTGLVQLTDVTPMVLDAAQVEPVQPLVGTAPTVDTATTDLATRIDEVVVLDRRAEVMVGITFPVNQGIIVTALLTYVVFGLVGLVLARRNRRLGVTPAVSVGFRRLLRLVSLFIASIPVATYLANLVPWWRFATADDISRATQLMLGLVLLVSCAVTALAAWLPVLQRPYRSVAFVAGTTLAVLVLDVLAGSRLQFASVLGLSPLAAGRFYGLGNVAFSVFAACAVFTTIAVAAPWVRHGRQVHAALAVGAIGVVVALVDGLPSLGADFGGMVALIAGFGTFALLVAGGRVSWRVVVAVVAAGVAFAAAVSVLDYLRPTGSRTHLGDFVASLFAGDAWPTVQRKLSASISSFTFSFAAPLIPIVWALFGWVVLQPQRFGATAITDLDARVPTFRHGLVSALVIAGLGALVNDSGVVVTATMLGVGLPLAVAAAADPAPAAPGAPTPTTPVERAPLRPSR
jgi:hypothetical protein